MRKPATRTSNDDVPRDHRGSEVLGVEECLELLASAPVGRIAYVDAGEPVVLPVAHVVDGWTIAFRTGPGSKLSAASMERPVAFEVDDVDPDTRTGWSVLVRGTAETVWSEEVEAELDALGLEPWIVADDWPRWVRIHPTEVTGRRIHPPADRETRR